MRTAPLFSGIVVDIAKLRDYCLSEAHPRGRHKARVFRAKLGLTANDADFLRRELIDAARRHSSKLVRVREDAYGTRFLLDFDLSTRRGDATIRSGWIVISGERVLRFVTCNILDGNRAPMSIRLRMNPIKLLDVVALTADLSDRGLVPGQVGTVVEVLGPDSYEVEFSDENGRTYAQMVLPADQLLVLHYEPLTA